jgi:hypothetical protein
LEVALAENSWQHRIDLLRWIVCMGASFATAKNVRAGYLKLVKMTVSEELGEEGYAQFTRPKPSLDESMRDFIWSATAFSTQVYDFWEEVTV